MIRGLISSLKTSLRKLLNTGAGSKDPALVSFLNDCARDPFAKYMEAALCSPVAKNVFPEIIEATPENLPVLTRIFGYKSQVFDLAAYDAVHPGSGKRIWDMFQAETTHQQWLREHSGFNPRDHGYHMR